MLRRALAASLVLVGCSFPTGDFRLDAQVSPPDRGVVDVPVVDVPPPKDLPGPDVADAPVAVDTPDAGADDSATDAPLADAPTDAADAPAPADVVDAAEDVSCAAPLIRCGAACVDTQTSADHCGVCDLRCNPDGGTDRCVAGACVPTCATGRGDCDGDPSNGCEADLGTSALHCGRCGAVCSNANGTPSCAMGRCAIECVDGFGDCDGDPSNGCEAPLDAPTNCGRCGVSCGTGSCVAGACVAMCTQTRCGGACVDLQTSAAHCGACERACMAANATPRCAMGVCGIGACTAGFADCDTMSANGCEVNTAADLANCGGCGIRCAFPNAAATCVSGRCGLGVCARGFANCNAMAVDGCEANVVSDPRNCGACGNVCTAQPGFTPICANGLCRAVMCPVGFSDCDGNAANGCETNLQTSATNCGACGASCARANATNACSAGVCTAPVCVTGFANCDGNALNGCEVSTVTDARNCGACGSVCRMAPGLGTASCAASRCAVACNAGYADCDRNPGNGCESSLNTVSNCGACGRVCGTGQTCSAGNCVLSSLLGSYSSRFFTFPGPAFISACAAPGRVVILPSQDDNAQLVPLPFAFRFWNVTYSANTQINVSTNGWLSFEPIIRNNLRGIIPDPTVPNAVIAPFWTDLVTGPGGICVATLGLAPNRQLVIEWTDAQLFAARGAPVRFEAVLFETTGQINFYYDTLAAVPDTEYVAVGIENPSGVAAHVNCNGSNVCTIGSGGRVAWVPN